MASLLEKLLAQPAAQTREVIYAKVINAVPSAPVEVAGEMVSKLNVTIDIDGQLRSLYPFTDSVKGLPTFIPKGGLNAVITLQSYKDGKTGEERVGCVAIGIQN